MVTVAKENKGPKTEKLKKLEDYVQHDTELGGLEILSKDPSTKAELIMMLFQWLENDAQTKVFPTEIRSENAPFCMFVGMQSTGKSSIINQLMGCEALFSDKETGTRCVTRVSLDKVHSKISFNKQEVPDIKALHSATVEHMKSIPGVSGTTAHISIPPNQTNLSTDLHDMALVLWDTPGVTSGKLEKFDSQVKDLVQEALKEYGYKNTSYIFLVEEFQQIAQLDNRYSHMLLDKTAKNLAIVVTKIDVPNHENLADSKDLAEYTSWDAYVKKKFESKGLSVDHVFFVGKEGKNLDEFKRFMNNEPLKGIDELRSFISNHMLATGVHLVRNAANAFEKYREILRKKNNDIKRNLEVIGGSKESSLSSFFDVSGHVLQALINDDAHIRNHDILEGDNLCGPIESFLEHPVSDGFPSFGDHVVQVKGTSFRKQVTEMVNQLSTIVLNLRPEKVTLEKLSRRQNANDEGGFSHTNALLKALRNFFYAKQNEIDQFIKRWFEYTIKMLVQGVISIIKDVPRFTHFLQNDQFLEDYKSLLTTFVYETVGVERTSKEINDLIRDYTFLTVLPLKGMVLAASALGGGSFKNTPAIVAAYGEKRNLIANLNDWATVEEAIRSTIDFDTSEDTTTRFNGVVEGISGYVMSHVSQVLHRRFGSGVHAIVEGHCRNDSLFCKFNDNHNRDMLILKKVQNLLQSVDGSWSVDLATQTRRCMDEEAKSKSVEAYYSFSDPAVMLEESRTKIDDNLGLLNEALKNLNKYNQLK